MKRRHRAKCLPGGPALRSLLRIGFERLGCCMRAGVALKVDIRVERLTAAACELPAWTTDADVLGAAQGVPGVIYDAAGGWVFDEGLDVAETVQVIISRTAAKCREGGPRDKF